MKKTLLALAAVALAMPAFADGASFKLETVWSHSNVGGVCDPVEGLDGGWNKPTPDHQSTATCSRFGVGRNGVIYTTDMIQNAIVSFNGAAAPVKVLELPAVTATRWNGTAISMDDAGNFVLNNNFTDKPGSMKLWTVINKKGEAVELELETSLDFLGFGTTNRLDIIGQVIGDVTSEEGGIAYACAMGSKAVVMYHFTGDGEQCTTVTAAVDYEVEGLTDTGNNNLLQPTAKYFTVAETLAEEYPAGAFYVVCGQRGASIEPGTLATTSGDEVTTLEGFGNRMYGLVNKFQLGGETYIVRNYVSEAKAENLTTWCGVMNFGIFNMKGELVAAWEESDYGSEYGMGTLTVEPVDDNSVNIYTFVAVGGAYKQTPQGTNAVRTNTEGGIYGAMVKATLQSAGVTEIEAGENAPAEYFNLQGVRVANPENGLYIRRSGNKAEKVIL